MQNRQTAVQPFAASDRGRDSSRRTLHTCMQPVNDTDLHCIPCRHPPMPPIYLIERTANAKWSQRSELEERGSFKNAAIIWR